MKKNDWMKKAEECLLNRTIVKIEWMSSEETEETLWDNCPICLKLDDGSWIFPLRDDEGNNGGALSYFKCLPNVSPNRTFPLFSTGWEKDGE